MPINKFNKNILTAVFLRGFSAILLFFLYQQISNKLGAVGTGVFSIMLSIQSLCVVFSSLGYNESIVKHIAQSYANNNTQSMSTIINIARTKTFPLAILSTLFILCYIYLVTDSTNHTKLPILVSLVIIPAIYIEQNASILRGVGLFQISWILIGIFMPSSMLIALYILNLTINESIFLYFIFNWILMFFSFFFLVKRGIKFNKKSIKINKNHTALVTSSRSLYVIGLFTAILDMDVLLIDYWFGSESTGIYSIVKKISLSASMLLVAVNSVISPQLSVFFEQKRIIELKQLLQKVFLILLLYAIPVTCLLVFFSTEILILFGEEFKQGKLILKIMALGQFINIITGPVGNILIMNNQEELLRNIIVVVSITSFVSYLIFIPIYGVIGAALITSLRVITQNLIVFSLVLKQNKKYAK